MNVSLGDKWETFVAKKVKSGDFQSASEVLREGLRLLEEREFLRRISVSSMEELEERLLSLRIFRTTSFFTECFPTASKSCASCTRHGISKKFLTVPYKLQGR